MTAAPGHLVAAALLPPLGVYLTRGGGQEFLVACGLTLFGFVPGAVFALYTVLRQPDVPVEAARA